MQIFFHEQSNQHSGAAVFLLGHLLSSIPFLFLISITSTLVFYFLVGLRDEFSLLMYFVLNIFTCLLANEGLMMVVAYIWLNTFSSIMTMIFVHVSIHILFYNDFSIYFHNSKENTNIISKLLFALNSQVLMMLVAGYFRIRYNLPQPVWKYPVSYVAFHTYSIQVGSLDFYCVYCSLS